MEKNHKFNLLYLTPATAPLFYLGYLNKSATLLIVGFIMLAFYVISGMIQAYKK